MLTIKLCTVQVCVEVYALTMHNTQHEHARFISIFSNMCGIIHRNNKSDSVFTFMSAMTGTCSPFIECKRWACLCTGTTHIFEFSMCAGGMSVQSNSKHVCTLLAC